MVEEEEKDQHEPDEDSEDRIIGEKEEDEEDQCESDQDSEDRIIEKEEPKDEDEAYGQGRRGASES